MESRTEKLLLARRKLKDHQDKKLVVRDISSKPYFKDCDEKSNLEKYAENYDQSVCDPTENKPIMDDHELSNKKNAHAQSMQNFNTQMDYPLQSIHLPFEEEDMKTNANYVSKETLLVDLREEKNMLNEVLILKDAEIKSLSNKIQLLEDQNDALLIRIQQLTDGFVVSSDDKYSKKDDNSALKSYSVMEEQLQLLQKERDQITMHYEHYVAELNEQLKSSICKNDQLFHEIQNLTSRELSLVEQISQMEIRLQEMKIYENNNNIEEITELKQNNSELENEVKKMQQEYAQALNKLTEAQTTLQYLKEKDQERVDQEKELDNVTVSKLSADIASDKLAAQRATEQNIKLKSDLEELEKAFIKMSRDKLELTEKLSAEKFLNRELTIKLAEKEETLKTTHSALVAKDKEMIRLITNYNELEKKLPVMEENGHKKEEETNATQNDFKQKNCEENVDLLTFDSGDVKITTNSSIIPKEDAMLKLQERFYKIMGDVANLSDEKHRLEHIITQLQNETDTICEYVALYQQQRSLLKKRDEERSAQIKAFQTECSNLRDKLSNLSKIIVKLSEEESLSAYFQIDSRRKEITQTLELLMNLKDNSIINSDSIDIVQFNNMYPCACCSGKLIDV